MRSQYYAKYTAYPAVIFGNVEVVQVKTGMSRVLIAPAFLLPVKATILRRMRLFMEKKGMARFIGRFGITAVSVLPLAPVPHGTYAMNPIPGGA